MHDRLAGAYEATNFFNKLAPKYDPDDVAWDAMQSRLLLLHNDVIAWNTPPEQIVATIKEYLAKRTKGGKQMDLVIYTWVARKVVEAGLWPDEW